MRTPQDDTPEYKESVRAAIVAREPELVTSGWFDEHALDLASCYLWWNGYKTFEEPYLYRSDTDDESTRHCTAHFVYDVLRWTEANT